MEKKLGQATRDAYGKTLVELGKENSNIVVLDADLSKSTKTDAFAKAYPDRFFDVGIQEANLVGVATGLASCGKIPFISSFACFLMNKGYEQLRMGVAYPNLNVKVVPSHGGISVGEDGASQQSIEDFALAATLPNFVVMHPADEFSMRVLLKKAALHKGPVYIRTGRPKAPVIYDDKTTFEIGKGKLLREGKDVTLVACGLLVFEALQAAEILQSQGIGAGVIDMHTIKPIDGELLLSQAKKTRAIVVAEEHLIWGGLGSAVSQFLSQNHPISMEFVGIRDEYAESGKSDELFVKFGLTSKEIVQAAQKALSPKAR